MAFPTAQAIPVTPQIPTGGMVSVMSLSQMDAAERAQNEARQQAQQPSPEQVTGLAGHIRREWDIMTTHRNSQAGWSQRLLQALRAFNGQYEPDKLNEIQKFGGSTIYARLIAAKCRGASSLLRDVYLTNERAWGLEAPDDPQIPRELFDAITKKVTSEVMTNRLAGVQNSPDDIRDRTNQLIEAARMAAKKAATKRVKIAEDKLNTILTTGGFYKAMAEFLVDLPVFPFACIKGPIVKVEAKVSWRDGVPFVEQVPRLCWSRISPFDLWWTPGVSDIADAAMIERVRYTRAELNDLLDIPGFNHDAVREVLQAYGAGGLADNWDMTDSARAAMESRENPVWNRSGLITCLEYHGNVQGILLKQLGFTEKQIPDEMRDYATQAWMIGHHLIKVQLSPNPRRRHPYFITSFEKVPGTPVGNALPDMLHDLQEAANGTLRSIMNNMAMASGPQVVVNDDRLSGMEDGESIFPWKRWHVTSDPVQTNSAQKPIEFFQPISNAQELMGLYEKFMAISDDISAIPRYLQGNSPGGGAGRTASGLAMLMGNASKVLQTVCANVDREVLDLVLHQLLDMVLLTDETDTLDGTEQVVVKGVAVALQRETLRSRQLEFLQATANPIDMQIIGPQGRAKVLRSVASTIGMPGEEIVPSEDALAQQQKDAEQAAQNAGIPGHGGMGEPAAQAQGDQPGAPSKDMGPRTNLMPSRLAGKIGGGVG